MNQVGRKQVIAVGAVILIAACLLVPLKEEVLLLGFAHFLLGLCWNFCFIVGSSLMIIQLHSNVRGCAQGAGEMAAALCAGAGSLSSGIIFTAAGILVLSLFSLGLSFVVLFLVLLLLIPRKQAQILPAGQD